MNHFETEPLPQSEREKTILLIENELLERAGCTPGNNEECKEWIDQYAKDFRDFVETHTGVVGRWLKNPSETLKEIESHLYAPDSR